MCVAIQRLPPQTGTDQVFAYVLEILSYFGADPEGVHTLGQLWQRYKDGGTTSRSRKEEMLRFSRRFPVTWANVVTAWIARCAHASARIFLLDHSTFAYQVDAVANRFNCTIKALPDTATSLCICTVCRKVRSLVREPSAASTKQTYVYGLKDVGIDLYTGKVTCRKAKSFMHMQCRTEGLGRVDMTGAVLEYRRKLYMMCPQKNCGHKFQLNPSHAHFNHRGAACPDCTLKLAREAHDRLRKQHPYAVEQGHKCFLCNKRISKARNAFIFARNTLVCSAPKHQLKLLTDYVRRHVSWLLLDKRHDSDEAMVAIRQAMLKFKDENKAAWASHNAKRNDAILRQLKKNAWSRKQIA